MFATMKGEEGTHTHTSTTGTPPALGFEPCSETSEGELGRGRSIAGSIGATRADFGAESDSDGLRANFGRERAVPGCARQNYSRGVS